MTKNQSKILSPRPPIVAVMGHVDHGKTSLLDYIRKTNLAVKEAGGITQSIGAYEIIHAEKKITFIDTPGHEAFSKMRTRGATAADLAILVVAADDGVKPQTKESIEILNATKTPFIVAINKIDKSNADIEKTKTDLTQNGVFLEGFGGNVSWHAVSAKTGEGINELLDLILLAGEMEDLKYNPSVKAKGVVIESKMDSRRGVAVSVIVKDGILKTGDEIFTQTASGKIRALENFLGEQANELPASSPALVSGFENLPVVGEEFFTDRNDFAGAEPLIKAEGKSPRFMKSASVEGLPFPAMPVILKADVSGSLEALSEIVKNVPQEKIKITIVEESVGGITDGDVKIASATKAMIIGFRVKAIKAAENLAKIQGVKIIASEIIYELLKALEEEIESAGEKGPSGELEILAVFSRKGKKQVIGGKVVSGTLKNKVQVKILKNNEEAGMGKIMNLQSGKQDVFQVHEGEECGILLESEIMAEKGDKLTVVG